MVARSPFGFSEAFRRGVLHDVLLEVEGGLGVNVPNASGLARCQRSRSQQTSSANLSVFRDGEPPVGASRSRSGRAANGPRSYITPMSKKVPLSDFRAVRTVLDPDDFALGGEEPDPPPSDLISEATWSGITGLPDDVAIRTSDHNGQALGESYTLWTQWIEAIGETEDALFVPMLDAADDLQTSLYSALHGYYRAGFSSLRNVLELMTVATCGCIQNSQRYQDWRNGSVEFPFGAGCDQLSHEPLLDAFNAGLRVMGYQSLWDAKDPRRNLPGGYARRLYSELSNYAHSRPGFTDGDLWKSNGPIYVGKVFFDWYFAYLRTISLCSVSMLFARPTGNRSALTELFTDDPNVLPPDLLEAFKLS